MECCEVKYTCKLIRVAKCGNDCSDESVLARNDFQQDSETSVAKGESPCVSNSHTRRFEAPAAENSQMDNSEIIEMLDESLILKFEEEVDQLAAALAVTSKVVSERRLGVIFVFSIVGVQSNLCLGCSRQNF